MMAGELSEAWGVYLETFRLHAHQLLAWAHSDIRQQLNQRLDEPSITGLLGDAMKARLNRPETPAEYDHYAITDQEPVSPAGQLGNDRLRLDLSVIRTGIRPRIAYIFEAKRLQVGGFPIGKYIGGGGMGDFLECRYGPGNPEAAMVGLYQNKDVLYWQSELARVFAESRADSSLSLEIVEDLAPISILDSLPHELHSRHRRRDDTHIRLFHIFLDCTAEVAISAPPW
jgi:hypothetical protein